MASIQGIYIALFGRPADPLGLEYFNGVTGNGADLAAISDLAATAEYQDRFEGMSNVQIINSIYQSLFGRDADLAGLTFFAQALQDGTFNINNIAIAILDGAQGDDLVTVNNKIEAANLFTASLDTGSEVAAYQGSGAAAQGVAFLSGITADEATIPTQAQVDAAIAAIVESPAGEGSIFTLTEASNVQTGGVDEIVGTSGNDTIRAVVGNSLDSTDIIDGGAGIDTLNISAGGIDSGAAPVIRNVENINNADGDLDLSSVTGVQRINSSANAVYTGASLSTTFGASGAATAIAINIAGSVAGKNDTLSLAVDDNAAAVAFSTVEADGTTDNSDTIEHITLSAEGDTGAKATADDVDLTAFTDVKTVTVSGAGDIDVDLSASTIVTSVNASAATGEFTVDASASTKDVTVVGSSGVNDITVGDANNSITGGAKADTIVAGDGDNTIVGGAGADDITVGNGDNTVTGGAGADTITLGTGENTLVYTAQSDSAYTNYDNVTGFTTDDVIDVSALGLAGATDAVTDGTATTTNTDFVQFAAGAADFFGDNAVAVWDDGVTTYVFADVNGDGNFSTGADLVIQLAGVVALDETNFSFA